MCSTFELDLAGDFGTCKCGRKKAEHSAAASGLASSSQQPPRPVSVRAAAVGASGRAPPPPPVTSRPTSFSKPPPAPPPPTAASPRATTWKCASCSFANPDHSATCDVCGASRIGGSASPSSARSVPSPPMRPTSSSFMDKMDTRAQQVVSVRLMPPPPPPPPATQLRNAVPSAPPAPLASEPPFAFIEECLSAHNRLRALHGAPPLEWDDACYRQAQMWADRMASTGVYEHSHAPGFGENLAMSTGDLTVQHSVQMWYDEIAAYNFASGAFSMLTGHFTQVVWAGTTRVGAGIAFAPSGATYICANYTPPGNVRGRFETNVLPPGTSAVIVKPAPPPPPLREVPPPPVRVVPPPPARSIPPPPARSIPPPPARISSAPPPPPPAAQQPSAAFIQECLEAHNYYRAHHGAPPLSWDAECYRVAQLWADKLAVSGSLEHSRLVGFGENIAMSQGPMTIANATQMWYNEIDLYDWQRGGFSLATGHFTQLVWAGTSRVGVAVVRARSGETFIVANYMLAGNIKGFFPSNVLPYR